ncbi:MAG TPA: DUF2182 domain-containing protein [Gemmatimonadaceae bacterium]|nr:DUF2182 domain-containing protein [Gemmatimonadaceae bacterium]
MRSESSVAGPVSRDQVIIASCIVLITVLAWTYLIRLDDQMTTSASSAAAMAKMGMTMNAAWSTRDFFFTFAMWAVMMVGMMAATVAPVLLLFANMKAKRTPEAFPVMALLFGLGYLVVWTGFSIAASLAQWGLHSSAFLSPGMAVASSRIAGAILVAAGVYQLTPVKGQCLKQCQSPLGFLLSNWREGRAGALEMGIRHGIYCLGCCWAIMLVLFAVGIMNLVWVAALTAFILLEKFGPVGARISQVGGAAMIAFGIFVIVNQRA